MLNIEHDDMGQKFVTEVDGEECLLAYTMINDCLNLHFMTVPDGKKGQEVAEELCLAAFNYARNRGLKIISSSAYIDEIFIKKHPQFEDLIETD